MTTMTAQLPGSVRRHLAALRALLVLTVITGILYPLVVLGIGQLAFPAQAGGSLVRADGHVVGSSLLGQAFTDAQGNPLPQWFQPRPSAAVNPDNKNDPGYNPLFSGPSNLGPSNPVLIKSIDARRAAVAAFNGVPPASVPPDALTASASGLDPDISPAYAYLQVNRVAKARGLNPAVVRALVRVHIQGRSAGILGEPRVNVLELNTALAGLH
jgi:potassium-transporting ATPase KdpC subunit